MDDIIKINIAVYTADEEIKNEVIKISEELSAKHETFFTVDDKYFFPHMTLYHVKIQREDLPKVKDVLEELLKNYTPFNAKATKPGGALGWIDIGFENSGEIKRLHEEVLEKISPFRVIEEHEVKFEGDIEIQKRNLDLYGSPMVMELYIPHITFTRFKEEEIAELEKQNIKWNFPEVTIDSVGIFMLGDHGTCVETIKMNKL